jgi:hypothetical protein
MVFLAIFAADLRAQPPQEADPDRDHEATSDLRLHGEARPGSLRSGMGFHEVIRSLGPPIERREHEANRETTWVYPSQKIFFKNGRVVAWAPQGDQLSKRGAREVEAPENRGSSKGEVIRGPESDPGTTTDDETIRQILGEILNAPAPPGITEK